jgi:hypothetical protein
MTKRQMNKMRAAAWSPAARRKRAATLAAKRKTDTIPLEAIGDRPLVPARPRAKLRGSMQENLDEARKLANRLWELLS